MLRRATELQENAGGAGEGLSLDEVQQIAAEIGISPEHLAQAAAEASQSHQGHEKSPSRFVRLLGGPFDLSVSRLISSETGEDTWGEIVVELNREAGVPGQTSAIGPALTWTSGEEVPRQATLISKDGTTEIFLQQQLFLFLAAYPVVLGLGGVLLSLLLETSGLFGSFAFNLGSMVLGLSALGLGCRAFVSASTRKALAKLEALGNRVQRIAGAGLPAPVAAGVKDQETEPLLDLEAEFTEDATEVNVSERLRQR